MNLNQITEWCVSANLWVAPEARGNPFIMGKANIAGLTGGEVKPISTSSIQKVNGRTITTISGSIYTLVGEPNELFLDFLKSKGLTYDSERPLDCMLGSFIRTAGE